MNKENILFGIVGLLLGLIVGFMFANNVNQKALSGSPAVAAQNPNFPPGHPEVPGAPAAPSVAEIQAAADQAQKEPGNFDAQMKAAEMYYGAGRYLEAADYLKKANEIKPDNYEVIVNLGNALFDGNKYDEAEKWYNKAAAQKPDDINVRTDLGLTYMFRTPPDYDRAIQDFEKSLTINPSHPQTLQNLTVAYTKKNDAAKAKATLAKLEGADPKNEAISKLREEIAKLGTK